MEELPLKKTRLSNFLSLFSNFDIFALKPILYFQGKSSKGTNFGFCLTVLFLIFFGICFFYFGSNLYYRTNPIVIYNQEFDSIPEKYILDPEITPIALEINDNMGINYFVDPNLFKINVSQLTIQRIEGKTKTSFLHYPMEICTKDHFSKIDKENQEYFYKFNLSNFFCIPKNLKNLTVQGTFDQDIFQGIKFTFYICNNTKEKNCKTIREIKNIMPTGYIGFYFLDSMVNPIDYNHPIKSSPKQINSNFDLNFNKGIDFFVKNNYIIDEDGLIFEHKEKRKIISFDDYKEFNFFSEKDDFFFLYIKMRQQKVTFNRIYTKFQDLLARIGGFLNIIFIIMFFINVTYAKLVFIREIIFDAFIVNFSKEFNENYSINKDLNNNEENKINIEIKKNNSYEEIKVENSFNDNNKNKQKNLNIWNSFEVQIENNLNIISKSKKIDTEKNRILNEEMKNENFVKIEPKTVSVLEILDIHHSQISISENKDDKDKDKDIIKKKNFELKQKENLNFLKKFSIFKLYFLDYVYFYTGLFKTEERQIKKIIILKGAEIMKECMDVNFIIKKFYEIEKLKCFLLSESQIKLFESLPKPQIDILYMKDQKRNNMTYSTRVLTKKNAQNIIN